MIALLLVLLAAAYVLMALTLWMLIPNASFWRCAAWGVILPGGALVDLWRYLRGPR